MADATPKPRRSRLGLLALLALILLIGLAVASYLRSFVIGFPIDPDLFQGPIKVVPFTETNLQPAFEIPPSSPEHARIVEWLQANRRGWVFDMKDHGAHTGLWTPHLRINLAHDRVTIGYDHNPGPSYMTWVSKRVPDAQQPVVTRPVDGPAAEPPGEAVRPPRSDELTVPPPAPRSAPR